MGYGASRRFLRSACSTWPDQTTRAFDPDCFEELSHYKWGYFDRHLTRRRAADVGAVLLELFPAKVIVEADELGEMIEGAKVSISSLVDNDKAVASHVKRFTLGSMPSERVCSVAGYRGGERARAGTDHAAGTRPLPARSPRRTPAIARLPAVATLRSENLDEGSGPPRRLH